MSVATKLHVRIGEVKTGGPGEVLTAILGSCVGLGFLHPARQIFGLAHCLLSDSGGVVSGIGARHVDQAAQSLKTLMAIRPEETRQIQAVIVGGANMTMPVDTDPSRLVGALNAGSAYKAVRALGIRNIFQDTGGVVGRQLTIDCTTGVFTVAEIPRIGRTS